MSALYWIHCNLCAALHSSKDTALYVLSCNHLLCKTCMQRSESGTKCPLCKTTGIKFIELSKLPSSQKEKFQSEMWRSIKNPLKSVNFQTAQKDNLTKMTLLYKIKAKKAAQVHAQMKAMLEKKKAEHEKLTQQRKLMQARLKEIYVRNLNKKPTQKYRPVDDFSNNLGISRASKSSSFFGSPYNADSKTKLPPLALYSTPTFFESSNRFNPAISDETNSIGSSMFASSSSKKIQPQHRSINDRSQANRSPFFA